MRIGIDATPLPYNPVGAGIYIIQLINALQQENTDQEIFVFAFPHILDHVNITESQRFKWVIKDYKSPPFRLIWEQAVLPILARQWRLDLLHSLHYTRPLILPCKSVVTFHDMTFYKLPSFHTKIKRMYFQYAIQASASLSDAIITVSENTRKDAINLLKLPNHKIFATPSGISNNFSPIKDYELLDKCRQKYKLPKEFILYVGLIEPRKNIPSLLRAYHKLSLKDKIPPLVIAGRPGWGMKEVNYYVDSLTLKDKVHFTGYVDKEDLPLIYNLATIFVYPSIYEGFGFPPLEAMACGTPTITTAISSMPEFVGDACLLVPPQDDEALYQAIKKLLYNKDLQQDLSIKGHQQASQFTWERTARETLEVYQKVMLQP